MKINLNNIDNKHFKNILLEIAQDNIDGEYLIGTEKELMDIQAKATKELLAMREGYTQFVEAIKENIKEEEFTNIDDEITFANIKSQDKQYKVHLIVQDTIEYKGSSWQMTQILLSNEGQLYTLKMDSDASKIFRAEIDKKEDLKLSIKKINTTQTQTKHIFIPKETENLTLSENFMISQLDNINEITSYLNTSRFKEISLDEAEIIINNSHNIKKQNNFIDNNER